jgi:hypothetical protein
MMNPKSRERLPYYQTSSRGSAAVSSPLRITAGLVYNYISIVRENAGFAKKAVVLTPVFNTVYVKHTCQLVSRNFKNSTRERRHPFPDFVMIPVILNSNHWYVVVIVGQLTPQEHAPIVSDPTTSPFILILDPHNQNHLEEATVIRAALDKVMHLFLAAEHACMLM